jgi:hypothetical protein
MHAITNKKKFVRPDAWGRDHEVYEQTFVVEESDIGRSVPHHLGYNRAAVVMTQRDVGRTRVVLTDDTGWTCWSWAS